MLGKQSVKNDESLKRYYGKQGEYEPAKRRSIL